MSSFIGKKKGSNRFNGWTSSGLFEEASRLILPEQLMDNGFKREYILTSAFMKSEFFIN